MPKEPSPALDAEAAHHLTIQSKIEAIAEGAGVAPEDRLTLEATLRALPRPERRRVRLYLQGIKAQSGNQAVQDAADGFLSLAAKAWEP